MKKLLLTLLVIGILYSCKQSGETQQAALAPLNTSGYQVSNATTDVPGNSTVEEDNSDAPVIIKRKTKKPRIVYVEEEAPQTTVIHKTSQASAPVSAPAEAGTSATGTSNDNQAANSGSGEVLGNGNQAPSGETKVQEKKKGWTKATKGAVIGGVAGAIGGAVINKRSRGTGAIIGAVIGAAGGYAIGRAKDKKEEKAADPFNLAMNNL